ncbi:MAG: GFA family protein [Myxococcales bacterium]|jgi:hypothetical protein|nr:GFA family protein [Myxococcales bacterium]
MRETQTYTGGCHCGRVRFEVQANLDTVISCNCSICSKSGFLAAFTPAAAFKQTSGQDSMKEYLFNKMRAHHQFCTHCGIKPFSHGKGPDGGDMVVFNVRCLDDIDLAGLKLTPFDGKSL